MENNEFAIECLDHVAILVNDLEVSAKWYEKVLGLKKYQLPEWREFPIFMLSGKSGIALFPAKLEKVTPDLKVDHFAFNVTNKNFERAKKKYAQLNLEFSIRDHHYFHSIYTKDPDGYTVELTTIMVNENEFYK